MFLLFFKKFELDKLEVFTPYWANRIRQRERFSCCFSLLELHKIKRFSFFWLTRIRRHQAFALIFVQNDLNVFTTFR